MDKKARFNLIFIGGGIGVFVLACLAAALGMIQVIRWYLSNCGTSATCSVADWLISYWWLLFVPGCLAGAFLLRRIYDRAYARLSHRE